MVVESYLSELQEYENIEKMGGSLTEEEDKRKRIIQGILKKLISDEVAQYPRAKKIGRAHV